MLGVIPEQRIKRVRPVFFAVGALPDKKTGVSPIPDVVGIGIEDCEGIGRTLRRSLPAHAAESRSRNEQHHRCPIYREQPPLHRFPPMATATSSLNSVALCNAT